MKPKDVRVTYGQKDNNPTLAFDFMLTAGYFSGKGCTSMSCLA